MRTRYVVASVLAVALNVFGQGTVNFSNSPSAVGGAGARIYDVDGTTPLAGTAFLAQLYAGPNLDSLVPIGAPLSFRTGAGAGFVDTSGGTARVLSTVAAGQPAYVQVRAWELPPGWTEFPVPIKLGASPVLVIPATGGWGEPPSLPVNLVGLQGFQLMWVPEPGVGLLGLLGAGVLWFWRRRRPARRQ